MSMLEMSVFLQYPTIANLLRITGIATEYLHLHKNDLGCQEQTTRQLLDLLLPLILLQYMFAMCLFQLGSQIEQCS